MEGSSTSSKTKIYMIIGLFILAAILLFAIIKGVGASRETTVINESVGGATATSGGLGGLIASLKGIFNGLDLSLVGRG